MWQDMRRARDGGTPRASLCAVCGGFGDGRFCGACVHRFASPTPRCARCAIAVPPSATQCGACVTDPPPQRLALAALDYAAPWDGLVARLKFDGALDLADGFAQRIADAARRAAMPAPDVLVPAPLAPQRLAARGYNQAWELARRVGARLGIPADAATLLRLRETRQQTGLPIAARAANVRGAFFVDPRRRAALRGRVVAVVDDVVTTGATAHEMATTLLAAGAAAVDLWMLARTPAPGGAA